MIILQELKILSKPIVCKWLEIFVQCPQEIYAFLKVATGAETDHFVEYMWLR